jgi:myo-inositol-1(or 4)-monophosphatase
MVDQRAARVSRWTPSRLDAMVDPDPSILLEIAESAAERAGKRVASIFHHGRFIISRKYDYAGSIVTSADIESEKLILAKIRASRIKSTVVSEERGKVDYGGHRIIWAVDPLDGTLNFAKRIPHFAISIGVIESGRTVAGAIYDPTLDEMFTARRGHGAYLNGSRIRVSGTTALRNAAIIFEWWDKEPSILDPLGLERKIYRYTRSLRSPGSIALNLCSIASGRFDGLITVFSKSPIYETPAGAVIVEEAGGQVTNSLGRSWESLSRSIVAAGPRLQRRLLSLIQQGH